MALPNQITFEISIPAKDGFFGRECISEACHRYFKVSQETVSDTMHCPYCGDAFSKDELLTQEQARFARDAAVSELMPLIEQEFGEMLKKAVQGSKNLSYKPGTPKRRPKPQPPHEQNVDSELECPECHTRFQVDGIFGYCPGCRSENLLLYDVNLAIIKQEVKAASAPDRALRHAYSDLVSTFETFCRKEAQRLGVEGGRFQNIKHTRKLFKKEAAVDILEGLQDEDIRCLKRVFEKRHVYDHNKGIASERYVKEIPEDVALLGEKVPLSLEELETSASVLRQVLEVLVAAR